MQKRHRTKADTFIIPIVLAGVVITSAFLQNIGEVLSYNPFHRPEPHCEEFPLLIIMKCIVKKERML